MRRDGPDIIIEGKDVEMSFTDEKNWHIVWTREEDLS